MESDLFKMHKQQDVIVQKDEKKENDKKHLHTKCVRDNIST